MTTTRHKIAIIHIPANANPLTILLSMSHMAATFVESKENGLITRYRNYFGLPIAGETDYPEKHSWSTVPAGYLSSSVSDMAKYLQMYLNEGMGIISQNSLNTMLYDNVYVDSDAPYYYGMGWTLTEEYTDFVLGYSGLVENYMSNMFLLLESGLGIIFLINMNDYLVTHQLAGKGESFMPCTEAYREHIMYTFHGF